MKHILILLALGILNSCNSNSSDLSSEITAEVDNCPDVPDELAQIDIDSLGDGFYNTFNYQIKDFVVDKDTIAASSFDYKFTLCRANNSWIVESRSNDAESGGRLEPDLDRDVRLQDKTYKYRVKLDTDDPREADRVIFELTTESSQPQQQILYTLEQTKQANAGIQLGEPEISEPLVYSDRLFWSVYTYHGEGFGGIATIISYDPATNKIEIIQPPEIASQIINDLVISGQPEEPTFWIATQLTGEGNPRIPSMGLVAYRPDGEDYTQGTIDSYRVDNSPIVGAIPTKLQLEDEILWIGTGNGICQVSWQAIARSDSWTCWRFAITALVNEELPIYSSVLDQTPDGTVSPRGNTVEVLWWSLTQREPVKGRYEIRHEPPMTFKSDRGATTWSELYQGNYQPPVWQPPVYWIGSNWHWNGDRVLNGAMRQRPEGTLHPKGAVSLMGETTPVPQGVCPDRRLRRLASFAGCTEGTSATDSLPKTALNRFVRGLDEVEFNMFGGGPTGIGSEPNTDYIFDHKALRGDLELLELTENTTEVNYYSAWVEDTSLQPYLTLIPHNIPAQTKPNPLLEIKSSLD